MKQPHIAIIVLHYKNLEDTRLCLKSLKNLTYQNHSIYLVNNDDAEHLEILKIEYPFIIPIQNDSNLGFAAGNNIGIKKALLDARVGAVVMLNNDTEVRQDFLEPMVQKNANMVAPRMMQYDDRNAIDNLGVTVYASGLPFNRTSEQEKLFCPSAGCALYSRELLEKVGLFDERFFAYCEDLDLGFRARLAGFKTAYAPDAVVYHKGSASTGKLSTFSVRQTYRNLVWVLWKDMPFFALLWQLPLICIGWLGLWAGYALAGRPLIIPRAFLEGYVWIMSFTKARHPIQSKRVATTQTVLSWFTPGLFPKKLPHKKNSRVR